jgi:hypothetical protein
MVSETPDGQNHSHSIVQIHHKHLISFELLPTSGVAARSKARHLITLLKSLTKSARNFFRRFGIYRSLFRFRNRVSCIGFIYNRSKKVPSPARFDKERKDISVATVWHIGNSH